MDEWMDSSLLGCLVWLLVDDRILLVAWMSLYALVGNRNRGACAHPRRTGAARRPSGNYGQGVCWIQWRKCLQGRQDETSKCRGAKRRKTLLWITHLKRVLARETRRYTFVCVTCCGRERERKKDGVAAFVAIDVELLAVKDLLNHSKHCGIRTYELYTSVRAMAAMRKYRFLAVGW